MVYVFFNITELTYIDYSCTFFQTFNLIDCNKFAYTPSISIIISVFLLIFVYFFIYFLNHQAFMI